MGAEILALVGQGFESAYRTTRACFAHCQRRGFASPTNIDEELGVLQYSEATRLRSLQSSNSGSQYLR